MREKSLLVSFAFALAVVIMFAGWAWLTRTSSLTTTTPNANQTQVAAPAKRDPNGVFADKPVTNCGAVVLPRQPAEINTVLDAYSKILMISFLDPRLGEDRHFYIRYEDPECRQNTDLKLIIDDALKVHAENVADTCRQMAEILRIGPPDVTVARVELAKRYLERWCK